MYHTLVYFKNLRLISANITDRLLVGVRQDLNLFVYLFVLIRCYMSGLDSGTHDAEVFFILPQPYT